MKAIRMTVSTTVELLSPLGETDKTTLTDKDRSDIRKKMKKDMTDQAKATGSKLKACVISRIELVDVK